MNDPASQSLDIQAEIAAHGGWLNAARRLFPGAPEPFLDLSTGINPVSYPIPLLGTKVFTRLPEPESVKALQAIAASAYHISDAAMVVAAPGTQILIDLLPRLFPRTQISILEPTYAEYRAAWQMAGAEVKTITAWDELGEAQNVILCNPNNPDGRRCRGEEIARLADRLGERNGILIVDEAFADFEETELSAAPYLPKPNLVILRSFGKSYGLAGLRLGFALAAPDVASIIRDALGPWAVSGPAIEIGHAALADAAWLRQSSDRLTRDVARLDANLTRAGLRVCGGTKLFRLAESPDAAGIFDRLGRAGILVRRFATQPHWLRFGIPEDGQWARLEGALS